MNSKTLYGILKLKLICNFWQQLFENNDALSMIVPKYVHKITTNLN